MHIKIDMEIPRWLSRLLLVSTTAGIIVAATWVHAAVPNTFRPGDTLSAQKINDNFAALQSDLTALSNQMAVLPRVERLQVNAPCTASPCTVTSQSSNWYSAVVRLDTGSYQVIIASGTFSSAPSCFVDLGKATELFEKPDVSNRATTSLFQFKSNSIQIATTAQYAISNTFEIKWVPMDVAFDILCVGPR